MANQVTVYKGDAAFGSFSTINEALSAINAQAGDYKIALNGTFTEAVHLSDWDGVNITFVNADNAAPATITGQVIVGNATSAGNKPTQYAWNGNLTFDGITFDYSGTVAKVGGAMAGITDCFALTYIGGAKLSGTDYVLTIKDCEFVGSAINMTDHLLSTPHKAATDGVQGILSVQGTSFTNGKLMFYRNSSAWTADGRVPFDNCEFVNAPVALMGNPGTKAYKFNNCDFSINLDLGKITVDPKDPKFSAFLLRVSENCKDAADIKGGTMAVTVTGTAPTGVEVEYGYILSWAPNGNDIAAQIELVGTQVINEQGLDFLVTKSPKESIGNPDKSDFVFSTLTATNVTGITADSLKNGDKAYLFTIDGAGNITQVIASNGRDEDGNIIYTVRDKDSVPKPNPVEIFVNASYDEASALQDAKIFGVDAFNTFAEAFAARTSFTESIIVRDGQKASLNSSVSTTNPAGLLIDMGNHGITIKNFAIVDSAGNPAEGNSVCSTVYSTNKTYGAGVTVKADILADVNGGTTTINGTVQVNGVLNQRGQIIVNGNLIVKDDIGVSCADVMLTVNGTLSAGKIYHNDNTTPGKIVIGKGGVATVADFILEKGKGATVEVAGDLVVTNSAETKKLTVAEGGSVTIDAADKFDVGAIAGAGDLIVNVAQGFAGARQILAAGTTAGFTGEVKVAGVEGVNVIKTADGAYGLSDADMSTLYISSDYASYENFAQISEGLFKNVNAFADVNAAEAVAQAYATKMVIVNGTNLTYAGTTFLNANPDEGGVNNAYDNVVSSDKTYDLEVNGTFKAYQVVLNNAATTVSATGRLLATGETLRVMGGTITVQGTRKANAAAPAEVFTGSWGGGTKAGADTQIQGGYIDINQGAKAAFDDTVIFVHAGFFNVNAATAAFDNTYIYLGSGGSYADIQMNITNGAEVTFANNTTVLNDATFGMHITVGEGSKLNLNNATLTLDNSKKNTSLTNNGTVTISGESTVKIATVTGNAVQVLDGAIVKDSTIGGGVFVAGNVTFRGANTFAMLYDYGTLTDYYGTTAPMAWTVEAGASLTLTDKARYGLGYGDKVTINGEIAANGAAAARAALTADPSAIKSSLFMHGLVAQESKGWNCDSSFTVKNAYVTIGSNNSFGNKPGNYGGTYTFLFDNAVLDASRITFYEALSKTNFTFKDSDVKTGTFMTRDADSVFTLQNTTLISTTATNGNDEGNYNAGTLNLQNSTLQYAAPVVNESGSINIADSTLIATTITNNGTITVSGASTVKADSVTGNGWVYMAGATIDEETSLKGANVRFASGENIVDGSVIKDGRFQVGTGLWGVEDPKVSKDGVTVTVKNNAFIGGFDGSASPFGGWVGSQGYDGKVVAADAPRYTLNVQNSNANFGYMHVSHDGVMTITGNAAEMQKYTGVEHSYYSGYLNINGVVTFDAANALVLFTNVSVDNGSTENPGKLIIQNGANYVSYRDSSTKDVSFTISQSGIVEVNNATLDLRHGTLINENASLSITNNGIFKGNAVTNNGTFSFDQTAKITVGSIVNTGTINFTVTGEAAATYMGGKVIDANADSNYGQVNVSVAGKNFEAVVKNNDLYVVDTTIYVNTAWATTGYKVGDKIVGAEGLYFGVNAFASLESISTELSRGARKVQFTYNGTANGFAAGLEITVKNDDGASLIYTFGGQVYASVGGNNVHEFAPKSNVPYIFDFKQGNFSFEVNEIKANAPVKPGTNDTPASGTVEVAVNEFTGRKEFAFEVVESAATTTYTEGTFELNITDLDGAAWVVLYDEYGKTVKEHVVIRDGKLTFDGLEAGKYTVAISAAGIPSEVKCDVAYNFTQEAVVVTDDTYENANDILYGTDAEITKFTAEDTIDWFKFTAAEGGVKAINFTGDGDFSVIAYTMNGDKLQQCAAFWVFDEKENGVDYTRYLNVAAGSEVYLRIEGYGKEVDYSVALA